MIKIHLGIIRFLKFIGGNADSRLTDREIYLRAKLAAKNARKRSQKKGLT